MPISFLDACRDLQLLGDPPLWEGQLPLYEWFDQGIRDGIEEFVVCAGRQIGKSEFATRAGLWMCCCRPDLDAVMKGGRSYALVLATDRGQARDILRRAVDRASASPVLSQLVESHTRDELRFRNGTVFMAAATDQASVRGRTYRYIHLDEIGHLLEGTGSSADVEEIVRAVGPGTAMLRGPRVLTSTPYGVDSWFGRRVQAAEKGELPHASLYRAKTGDVNPFVSPDQLAEAERDDPDSFKAEYLGELVGSGGALIPEEALAAAIISEAELDPSQGVGWVAGIDVGFFRDPLAVVVVGHDPADHHRLVVGAVRRWEPPKKSLKPQTASARRRLQDEILGQVADLLRRFGVWEVAFDGYEGPLLRETLAGVELRQLTMTSAARTEVFSAVRGRLVAGRLGLYRDEHLVGELRRLRTSTRGGSLTIPLPRSGGHHFDTAIALGLGVWLADRHERPGEALPFTVDVSEFDRRLPSLSIFGSDRSRLPRTADAVRSYRF